MRRLGNTMEQGAIRGTLYAERKERGFQSVMLSMREKEGERKSSHDRRYERSASETASGNPEAVSNCFLFRDYLSNQVW